MSEGEGRVPSGRLRRLGKMVALGPKAGLALAGGALHLGAGEPGERLGEALFATLGEMKAGSLKVGQMMAQAADGLPEAMRVRLGRLYSRAPALQWEAVAQVLEAELGRPPEQVFADMEHTPFAGASLGQVHRAHLPDGTLVAVKVQYPGVAKALENDLDLLKAATRTIGAGGLLLDTQGYFTALRDATLAELDYCQEAAWLQRMADAVAPWPDLVVPRFYPDFSSARVLCSDLLEGATLHEHFDVEGDPQERFALGCRLACAIFGPLFRGAIINADAHPGNFVVLEGQRLGLLDFGAVSPVPPALVKGVAELVPALMEPAGQDFVARFAAAGIGVRKVDPKVRAVVEAFADIMGTPMRGVRHFGRDPLLERVGHIKQRYPLQMLQFKIDPGLLPVCRAMLGLYHALKHLQVEGDLGAVALELAGLLPVSADPGA